MSAPTRPAVPEATSESPGAGGSGGAGGGANGGGAPADLGALVELFGEVVELKRVHAAGWRGSWAAGAFALAWRRLQSGEPAGTVAASTVREALLATRFHGVDAAFFRECGLSAAEAAEVERRGLDDALAGTGPWAARVLDLIEREPSPGRPSAAGGPTPGLVAALADQPRAGATRPGRPTLVLVPAESHAEHCLVVAVLAAIVAAGVPGADPATGFLAGLAHHLHNTRLPDAGFRGEELLGPYLATVVGHCTEAALEDLAPALADRVRAALAVPARAEGPDATAFHAADVLDRVLEAGHHARAAAFTLGEAMDDFELVHAGPVQAYHLDVLRSAGLWE